MEFAGQRSSLMRVMVCVHANILQQKSEFKLPELTEAAAKCLVNLMVEAPSAAVPPEHQKIVRQRC